MSDIVPGTWNYEAFGQNVLRSPECRAMLESLAQSAPSAVGKPGNAKSTEIKVVGKRLEARIKVEVGR